MDSLKNVQKAWDSFAKEKPFWSVLTSDEQGNIDSFYESGKRDINVIFQEAGSLNLEFREGTALDFGCGLGRLTFPLCARFDKVSAVDISSRMIELASSHKDCPANATFHKLDSSKLKLFESESFDFIVSLIVLQHMPKRHAMSYMKEFMRITKPDGIIVFQVPTAREKIVTGKARFWEDKPLTWDNPSFPKLCYRFFSRTARWTSRMLRRPLLSNEVRYRLECSWKRLTGKRIMQMNTVRAEEVEKIAIRNSCEIVAVREDDRAGNGFTSNLFYIKKNTQSGL